ncbi:helix-turn-helix domain-containing protein [soil metagenome]
MLYQKIKPHPALQPFVECYFLWESNVLHFPLQVESPPNGFAAMVFNFGDTYTYETGPAPRSFITGQATHNYTMELKGKIGMAGIVFKPASFTSLFGIPMVHFTNIREDVNLVLGNDLDYLQDKITEAECNSIRINIIEEFLLKKLKKSRLKLDKIDQAVELILEKNGVISVKDLLEEFPICSRQFQRKFLSKVGVSPKYYLRIKRLGFLCHLIISRQKIDWQDLIYEAGFYDQSHFIKDFIEFIGKNPSAYVRENKELANFTKVLV